MLAAGSKGSAVVYRTLDTSGEDVLIYGTMEWSIFVRRQASKMSRGVNASTLGGSHAYC
jgi:hypothetical protein